jgi:uncharacterized protein YdeI (YjbR/CyaY-like superfamily)
MSPKQKFRAVIEDAGGGGAYVDHPQALAFFMRLSYTHQKEYVRWIEEARRAQTRQSRVAQTVEKLLQEEEER